MQRFFSTVLIAASAVSVAAAGLAFSTGTHAQEVRMTSLTFIEHATTDTVIDTGAKGDSSGDLLTFSNEVFDAQDKEKVGTDSGWCIRIVAGKHGNVSGR